MSKASPIPRGRAGRLLRLGRLTGGIAGGVIGEGARQWVAGDRPELADLLLTPGNARRLADHLSAMRGAAMKVGQLLSMDAGDYLPPELTGILARLRDNAQPMPLGQVARVLRGAWGQGWEKRFRRFHFTPLAAASIGQVHEAITADGRRVAIKVQYPGVRDSIDSDLRNVAALLKLFRLVPEELDLSTLLDEAGRQLYREADYLAEAGAIDAYAALVDDDPGLELPQVEQALTTPDVLTMSYVDGAPIESVAEASRRTRDDIATRLMVLTLKELLEWGLVQTDGNFANYRYDAARDRIGLLDFGATRRYPAERIDGFRRLIAAAARWDRRGIESHAIRLGYLRPDEAPEYRAAMIEMIATVAEPARLGGPFGFAASDLSKRVAEQAAALRVSQRYWHLPPTEMLFLHRKLGGTYLLCARLRARVDVRALVAPYLD